MADDSYVDVDDPDVDEIINIAMRHAAAYLNSKVGGDIENKDNVVKRRDDAISNIRKLLQTKSKDIQQTVYKIIDSRVNDTNISPLLKEFYDMLNQVVSKDFDDSKEAKNSSQDNNPNIPSIQKDIFDIVCEYDLDININDYKIIQCAKIFKKMILSTKAHVGDIDWICNAFKTFEDNDRIQIFGNAIAFYSSFRHLIMKYYFFVHTQQCQRWLSKEDLRDLDRKYHDLTRLSDGTYEYTYNKTKEFYTLFFQLVDTICKFRYLWCCNSALVGLRDDKIKNDSSLINPDFIWIRLSMTKLDDVVVLKHRDKNYIIKAFLLEHMRNSKSNRYQLNFPGIMEYLYDKYSNKNVICNDMKWIKMTDLYAKVTSKEYTDTVDQEYNDFLKQLT
jgi:hypothetical protein